MRKKIQDDDKSNQRERKNYSFLVHVWALTNYQTKLQKRNSILPYEYLKFSFETNWMQKMQKNISKTTI